MNITAKFLPAVLLAAAMAIPAHAAVRQTSHEMIAGMQAVNLEGRAVIGMNGHRLGYVLAVNQRAHSLDVQTPGGIAVTMPESRVRDFGGQLFALNMTRHDMLAMARAQTGRTMAQNINLRSGRIRG